MAPDHELLVATARRVLMEGGADHDVGPPFSEEIRRAERAVVQQLNQYDDPSSDDHLYVLEFQGVGQQHVMYGRTRSWRRRLLSHRQAAVPHGFVLLNGWLSPGVGDAYPLERFALAVGGLLHGRCHFRERFYTMRFYTMRFDVGLCVARAVFELGNHCSMKRQRTRPSRYVDLSELADKSSCPANSRR